MPADLLAFLLNFGHPLLVGFDELFAVTMGIYKILSFQTTKLWFLSISLYLHFKCSPWPFSCCCGRWPLFLYICQQWCSSSYVILPILLSLFIRWPHYLSQTHCSVYSDVCISTLHFSISFARWVQQELSNSQRNATEHLTSSLSIISG